MTSKNFADQEYTKITDFPKYSVTVGNTKHFLNIRHHFVWALGKTDLWMVVISYVFVKRELH